MDTLEVAERAAVDVVAHHELVARARELGDRRGRGRAAREGDPVCASLEGRDGPLQALARRVLGPGVFVAAARPADAVLGVRRRLVDGRRHRPRQGIRLLAGVDGQRLDRPARVDGGAVVFGHGRIPVTGASRSLTDLGHRRIFA
jgi:hypothetical protein